MRIDHRSTAARRFRMPPGSPTGRHSLFRLPIISSVHHLESWFQSTRNRAIFSAHNRALRTGTQAQFTSDEPTA